MAIVIRDADNNTAQLVPGLVIYERRQYGPYAAPGKVGTPLSRQTVVTDFWFGIRNSGYDAKSSQRVQASIDNANALNPGLESRLAIRLKSGHINGNLKQDGTYTIDYYLTPKGDVL